MGERTLAGRTALVTGAARGLGRAISERLASLGAQVVLGDVTADALAEAARSIQEGGGDAVSCVFDVSDAGAVRSAFASIGQV
jgi:NAD(P)-dependent dehydrogenase (short-subunit alcohol dehydrogenase family)